jgi:hypothetical protein
MAAVGIFDVVPPLAQIVTLSVMPAREAAASRCQSWPGFQPEQRLVAGQFRSNYRHRALYFPPG